MAVLSTVNRTNAGSGLGGDVRDARLAIVDNKSVAGDNRLAVGDNGSTTRINKKTDVDNRLNAQAGNQADAGSGNRSDADLILNNAGQQDVEDTGYIRADLIKNFNNGVPIIVSAKLSRIVPDKYIMDFSAWILADVINNPFGDLSPFSMALPSFLSLLSLPTLTTGNLSNILTTFRYYKLILSVESCFLLMALLSFLFFLALLISITGNSGSIPTTFTYYILICM